jgi:hypothetical protein
LAARLLFDKKVLSPARTGDAMRFRLSHAQEPFAAAQWLEGFLHGSGLLLVHFQELWKILDAWVGDLEEENFKELLPLLRRTFSQFSEPERQKMLDLAKNISPTDIRRHESDWDAERAEGALALVRGIFGNT